MSQIFKSQRRDTNKIALIELWFFVSLVFNLLFIVSYTYYSLFYRYMQYGFAICSVVIILILNKIYVKKTVFYGTIFFMFIVVLAVMMNNSGFGVLMQFVWPLSIILMFQKTKISSNFYKHLCNLFGIVWILSLLKAFIQYTDSYMNNFSAEIQDINPNTVALAIAASCLIIRNLNKKVQNSRWINFILVVMSLLGIYRCRSRAMLVALLAVILLEMFWKKIMTSMRLGFIIMLLIIIVGTCFPLVYVAMYNNGLFMGEAFQLLGKSIYTGRQFIWINLFEYMENNPITYLWGTGYNTTFYVQETFNLHNAYLMIFAQYGGVVFSLYMFFILQSVRGAYVNGEINNIQFGAYQLLLFVLIVGFGETNLSFLPSLIFPALAIGILINEAVRRREHV